MDANSLVPIKDRILVIDLQFGEIKSKSGIILMDDNGTSAGIKPRWGKVFKVGPLQKEVIPGDYILLDHGRWTRAFDVTINDQKHKMVMADYPK